MVRLWPVRHKLSTEPAANPLLTRLAENEDVLIRVYSLLTVAVTAGRRIAPAGEWLLDNFYLIEEQIHMGKRHLPKGYSRVLPRLMNGASAEGTVGVMADNLINIRRVLAAQA
jgi:cyclic beta-1,2-glucan synthetase